MTRNEWINTISNDELAFRLYGKGYFQRTCLECVFFKEDEHGHWKCKSAENAEECERLYQEWLDEEMD